MARKAIVHEQFDGYRACIGINGVNRIDTDPDSDPDADDELFPNAVARNHQAGSVCLDQMGSGVGFRGRSQNVANGVFKLYAA